MKKVLLLTIIGLVVASVQADLLNHWTMNEGSGYTTADSGTGGNDGVFQEGASAAVNPGEGPTWVIDSLRGTALSFDGTTDYILTDSDGVLGDTPRTVACWFYLAADQHRHTLVEWGDGSSAGQYFRLVIEDNRFRLEVANGNSLALNADDLSNNQWYHMALVLDDFNGDGNVATFDAKWYLNGVEVPRAAFAGRAIDTAQNGDDWVRLGGGADFDGSGVPREPLNGMLDDVRIYNTALTDAQILALNNIRAWNPSPAMDAVQQGTVNGSHVDVAMSWNTAVDPDNESVPNPNITKHYVYIHEGDPNFADVTPVEVSAGSPTEATASTTQLLVFDGLYYWRIDESISDSAPSDANTITGPVWSFETLPSRPIVDTPPAHAAVFNGQPASFTVAVTSISSESYQWYKSDDNSNTTLDGDVPVGTDSDTYSITASSAGDEAYYYCVITNDGGTTTTEPAYLTIKRMVLDWALEYDFGDSSGEGNHAVIYSVSDPNNPTFSTDVPGAVGTYSASFDGQIQQIQVPVDPNQGFHSGYTLTLWLKSAVWSQPQYTGLFNTNNMTTEGFQLDFSNSANQYRYHTLTVDGIFGPASTEWVHLAIVCDGTDTTLYYNLEGDNAVLLEGTSDIDFNQFQVGCNRNSSAFFSGLIDDVKIWNYPRAFAELASSVDDPSDYFEVTGKGVCESHPEMDLDGDCKVSISDLSTLAAQWLMCGLQPVEACSL